MKFLEQIMKEHFKIKVFHLALLETCDTFFEETWKKIMKNIRILCLESYSCAQAEIFFEFE